MTVMTAPSQGSEAQPDRRPRKLGWGGRALWAFIGVCFTVLVFEVGLRASGWAVVRERSGVQRADAKYTVLCAGDSFVFGIGGLDFPSQLETALNQRAGERLFHVINAGIPGQNTAMLADELSANIDKYKANLVVVVSGENNSWNSIRLKTGGEKVPWTFAVDRLLLHSSAYKFFKLMTIGLFHSTFHDWWDTDRALEKIALYMTEAEGSKAPPALPAQGADLMRKANEVGNGQGHFEEAIELLKEVVRLNPEYPDGYADMSTAYLRLNRLDDAVKILEEGEKRCGKGSTELFLQLGRTHERRHEPELAIAAYKRGLKAFPQNQWLYQALAQTYTMTGDTWKILEFSAEFPAIATNPLHRYVSRLHEKNPNADTRALVSAGLRSDTVRMSSVAKAHHVPILFGSYPRNVIREVREAAQEQGVPFIDMTQIFAGKYTRTDEYISPDGCHCNSTGYQTMAESFASEVESQLGVGRPTASK